ncbi:MAG TPA: 2-oxo acid dehydrogenase subunit E2, partial [Planctomycetes bacterium]|nr:2-oxo acid dehydrogenase subunit E2 [Planctomycetota bacterium]
MYEFKLPDLGEGIHEGEILKWFVKPGDVIEEDAPLVEVETDKAAVTIPSPKGGKILSLGAPEGAMVTVGQVLVSIDDGSGEAPAAEEKAAPAPPTPGPPPRGAPPEAPAGAPAGPRPAAPATRRLARELGLDLSLVPGTGPGGRITPEDVRAFAGGKTQPAGEPPQPPPPVGGAGIPFLEVEELPDFSQ